MRSVQLSVDVSVLNSAVAISDGVKECLVEFPTCFLGWDGGDIVIDEARWAKRGSMA